MYLDYSDEGDFLACTIVYSKDQVKGYVTGEDQELGESLLAD